MQPYTGKNAKLAKISSEIVSQRRLIQKCWRKAGGKQLRRAMRQESRQECRQYNYRSEIVYDLQVNGYSIGIFDDFTQARWASYDIPAAIVQIEIIGKCLNTGKVFSKYQPY